MRAPPGACRGQPAPAAGAGLATASRRRAILAALLLALPLPAAADPAVPVADLPPLPAVASDENLASIAVLSATKSEEDVVVGASKREQSLGNVASAVTVISGDRLRRFGYRNLAEALRAIAGVYVVDDRMTDHLGIRGLQLLSDYNTRFLVLVDGATVNEPWNQYAGVGWDLPISIDEVARIELVRGPVSSVYGTNAFFGIINIVTRSADQSRKVYGRIGGGSVDTFMATAGFAAGTVDRQIRGHVACLDRLGETLSVPDAGGARETEADGITALAASLVGQFQGAFGQVRAFRRTRELPFAPYETQIGNDRTFMRDTLLLTEAGYTRQIGRLSVTGRAYLNLYRYQDYLAYEAAVDDFVDFGDSVWMGAEIRGRWEVLPGGRLGLTVGGEVTRNHVESRSYLKADGEGAPITTDFDVEGVYAEADGVVTAWLTASGGLRFDNNSLFASSLSPRVALMLHRGEAFGGKLLYARGFRNPSAYEAFFADGADYIANPDLAPERISSYEGVLWGRPTPGTSLRLSVFRWDLTDLLGQTLVSTGAGDRLQFQNISSMSSTGVEVEASYRDTRGWFGSLGGTYAHVTQEASDGASRRVLNSPALVVTAGLSTPRLWRLFHVSTEAQLVSGRLTRDETGGRTDAWVGWNVALYAPALVGGLDLTVGARNLVGRREQVPVGDEADRATPIYTIPGEGREVYLRVGYSY
jgi:outer membrane receptor for ferrienterochelin and colicins